MALNNGRTGREIDQELRSTDFNKKDFGGINLNNSQKTNKPDVDWEKSMGVFRQCT